MATAWISIIALGAIAGVAGQCMRVVVGLKKAKDEAAGEGRRFTEKFEPSTLLLSLLIGAVAGMIAAMVALNPGAPVSKQTVFALAAAGYSGADFIEGFVARYMPRMGQPPAQSQPVQQAPVQSPASEPRPGGLIADAGPSEQIANSERLGG
ncbi:MAG TPA: hypothetical protein VFQ82_05720 [Stellaceae bacterium]|nr:hypothetical protein [Stellaceae bacterium]